MKKPNILIFMTDQQHFSTIAKDSLCITPNIDALIDRGVLFNNAFCPSPICTPARTSLQTGLFPHQHKMMHNAHQGKNQHIIGDVDDSVSMLGGALTQSGYNTAYIGKWDSGIKKGPLEHGYRHYEFPTTRANPDNYYGHVRLDNEKDSFRATISALTDEPAEKMEPAAVAETVCSYIDKLSDSDKPFYIYSTTLSPHVPWICSKEYANLYPPEKFGEWASFKDTFDDKPGSYLRHYNKHNYCHINDWSKTAQALSCYFGTISMIDAAFGRIIDHLKKTDCFDNTLIIFTSDHGEHMGEHGLIGKDDNLMDSVVRIPLVISCPYMFAPAVSNSFVSLTDIYATLMGLSGSGQPIPPSSRSMVPLLTGKESNAFPNRIFLEHNGSSFFNTVRGIRTDKYKYVFRPHETDELYDILSDPHELVNRINDKTLESTAYKLKQELIKWMDETNDNGAKGAANLLLG